MSGRFLLGKDPQTGFANTVEVRNGKLEVNDPMPYEMAVAAGYSLGVHRTIFMTDLYDTRTSPKAIWNFQSINYPEIGTKKKFYISSSSIADSGQLIRVTGIDENLNEQWGYAITNGTSQVVIQDAQSGGVDCEFVHINPETINASSGQLPLQGILYVAEFAGGPLNLPTQNSLVHDVIHRITTQFLPVESSAEQSSKGSYMFGNSVLKSNGERYIPSDIFITTFSKLPKDGSRIGSTVSIWQLGNPPIKQLQFSNITGQSDVGEINNILVGTGSFFRIDRGTLLNIYVSMDAVNSSFGILMQILMV